MLGYNFVYSKFYDFFLKIGKEDDPKFKALIFFTFWIFLYLLNLYGIVVYFFDSVNIPDWVGGLFILLLLVFNYYYFVKRGNFKGSAKRNVKSKRRNSLLALVIMICFLFTPLIGIVGLFFLYN
jgi:hypothetical protein